MLRRLVLAAALLALTGGGAGAQTAPADQPRRLVLAFEADGRVRLFAQNVSVRDILAEWARQCGCYVVNADRLDSAPMTVPLLFEHAPQAEVLRSLLREAAGYVLTPRRTGSSGPSTYETIYVLPTSSTPATPYVADRTFVQPVPLTTPGSPDDELPPLQPIAAPDPVDPAKPINPPAEEKRNPGDLSVPGVRVVPIAPVSAPPSGAPQPPAPAPGPAAPDR